MTKKKELSLNELSKVSGGTEEIVEGVKFKFKVGDYIEQVIAHGLGGSIATVRCKINARGYYENKSNPIYYLDAVKGGENIHNGWYHEYDILHNDYNWYRAYQSGVHKVDGD